MLREKAGITKVQKLYVQLLYRCNFNCKHCFHGERLSWSDSFSFEEARHLLTTFKNEYGITVVTFLGGEPFLYRNLAKLIRYAKQLSLRVEVCTNGYKIKSKLQESAHEIDNLRISLDGLEETNDCIRHPGSFAAALETLGIAQALDVYTSVTMTVNAKNFREVIPLTSVVADHGAKEMKLHCLRIVGNALTHPDLVVRDVNIYENLVREISENRESLPIPILLDEDLDPQCSLVEEGRRVQEELERIEVQPSGELYVSCKAVGADSNAFVYDKKTGRILYQPKRKNNELELRVPQVRYSKL